MEQGRCRANGRMRGDCGRDCRHGRRRQSQGGQAQPRGCRWSRSGGAGGGAGAGAACGGAAARELEAGPAAAHLARLAVDVAEQNAVDHRLGHLDLGHRGGGVNIDDLAGAWG